MLAVTSLKRNPVLPDLPTVSEAALPALAAEAAQQWTARFNPRDVDVLDLQALYRAAL